ncbi:hypothetical protein GCM10020000_11590 [Streptomyces olivoverticillatus]
MGATIAQGRVPAADCDPTPRGVRDPACRAFGGRQPLTQVLPKVGLSRPTTSIVFPQMLIGIWIGIWMTLPEMTPGEPAATAPASESAKAIPEVPVTARSSSGGQQGLPWRYATCLNLSNGW